MYYGNQCLIVAVIDLPGRTDTDARELNKKEQNMYFSFFVVERGYPKPHELPWIHPCSMVSANPTPHTHPSLHWKFWVRTQMFSLMLQSIHPTT